MVKQTSSPDHSIQFNENITLNSVIEWISENKKTILATIAVLLVLLILAFRLMAYRNQNAENDFIKGDALFNQFQKNVIGNFDDAKKELQQLDGLMNRHQDLHVKFDGAIAQSLFIAGESSLAVPYADNVFKRVKSDHLSDYRDFSDVSFLIAKGEFEAALDKSKQLNLKLNEESQALYLYNLIRIAILNGQLNNPDEEEKTWLQLQSLLNKSEAGIQLKQVLQSGKSSLQQYIDEKLIF
ncbi:MAG: hypothetical protein Q8K60_06295 [Parachlamydiaceae bacterium]|nr:hypothetical protein [Parachlamydiaceae bacterium]